MLHTCEQGTWTPDAGKELDAMVYGLQHDHAYEYSSIDDDYIEDVNTSYYLVTESELMDTDCETDDEMQCYHLNGNRNLSSSKISSTNCSNAAPNVNSRSYNWKRWQQAQC